MMPLIATPDEERFSFVLLSAEHDVSDFHCEESELNEFLLNDALTETQRNLSRTYLLLDGQGTAGVTVAGYFALHADSITIEERAEEGEYIVEYIFPLVYIGFLGRDYRYKGKGLGDLLLLEAFRCTTKAAESIGIAGIHLATTLSGKRLYKKHGFFQHPDGGNKLLIPIADVRAVVANL